MRILVTGGLGFVGTNLLPHILKDTKVSKVTVLDIITYTSNPEILAELSKNNKFEFVRGDVRNEGLVSDLVSRHDHIIHLASETFVDKSIARSKDFFDVNVMGAHTVFEAARKSKIRKIVHASTDEVWGEAKPGTSFSESSPYAPRNPYSASKASADHLVRSFGETYGVPYNIVHFTNLYGPWQYPEKLIPKSIINLTQDRKISIYGDGQNIRVWLHVEDSINGLLRVLENGRDGESYALGSKDELTNMEVVRTLLEIFRKDEREIEFVADRPGHDLRYSVDYSKITRELGWEPQIEFREGVRDKVKWFKKHSDWWGRRR